MTVAGRRPGLAARLGGLAAVVALAVAAAGCGSDEDASPPDAGAEVEGRTPTSAGATDDASTSAPNGSDEAAPGPLDAVRVELEPLVELDAPTKLVARPESDLVYVGEQGGRVVVVDPDAPDASTVALDLGDEVQAGGEQGLLGLAFSLDGSVLYVHHSGTEGETRVASYAMDGDVADPTTRVDLLTVEQPFPNHNGGELLVDPDGLLWIGLGDGGAADDPDQRAQDPDDLLGKVLRIDPNGGDQGTPYGIPADNPFASGGGRPEVAVVGARNPWRMRFDEATGDLWIADVGQNAVEEIDRLPAGEILGANLGWGRWEGSDEYQPDHELGPGPLIGPVFEMDHTDDWCSVSGGVVYRGSAIEDLAGAYLFGDYCKPGLSAIRLDGATVSETVVLDAEVPAVVSVDADADGEVYVLSLEGTVFRVVAAT